MLPQSTYSNRMRSVFLIAHNIRSCHNVGSLLRTAEGLGVKCVYLTGYTPYPRQTDDSRLPHIARKNHLAISKTALGAENNISWIHEENLDNVINSLQAKNVTVCALEQTPNSLPLPEFAPPDNLAILLGEEVNGINKELLARVTTHLEIPMFGQKESFNVVEAATMAMYHCRFYPSSPNQ